MPFKIVRNDITKMQVGAIVNAANTALAPGGGVCGNIFAAAGYDKLEAACRKIGYCDSGSAVITRCRGIHLKSKNPTNRMAVGFFFITPCFPKLNHISILIRKRTYLMNISLGLPI